MKSKEHEIVVRVRFDKPVTKTAARRAVRDLVDPVGIETYASIYVEEKDGWSKMRAKGVRLLKPAEEGQDAC